MAGDVVLWDFDGTLAVRPGKWRGALIQALTAIDPRHGLSADDLSPGLRGGFPWHRPQTGHPSLNSPDAWWSALQPSLTTAYTRAGIDPALAARAAHAVRTYYTDPRGWTVFPDAGPVLQELAAAGWRHVVVSNHVPELGDLLRALGLARHFTDVVNSALIGWEKPHPRIFQAALERAGRPRRVWMVGDNPVADIAGADAAGIPGILLDPGGQGLRPAAHRILAGAGPADPAGPGPISPLSS